jgi:hypothetical protein
MWNEDPSSRWELVSNQRCDTSLFPYQAEGPFETPIPTFAEIVAALPQSMREEDFRARPVWQVGSYFVKMGTGAVIFQVRCCSQRFFRL